MKKEKVILGKHAIFSNDCEESGINNNVLVCGGTGCGKTVSIAEPRLLETFHSSLIITVTKRRLVDKYRPLFEERGYVVEELNFVNPKEGSVAFDPAQYLKDDNDITCLAESIVKMGGGKGGGSKDPYWDSAAVSLLTAEIAGVRALSKEQEREFCFTDVLELHRCARPEVERAGKWRSQANSEFSRLTGKEDASFANACWKTYCRLPSRTAGCVYGILNTALYNTFTEDLQRMMERMETVDFEKQASQKTVLFVVTSPVNPALNRFVRLFYTQAFKSLFEFAENQADGKLPIPVHMLCDDFATGGRIARFPEYISIFREKQMSVTLLIQSESQLERMYGARAAVTIINNCDTYVYMGGMDIHTGRAISARANVPLEDVLYMQIGKEFIFRRGQQPIFTDRYNIFDDTTYQTVTKQYEETMEM